MSTPPIRFTVMPPLRSILPSNQSSRLGNSNPLQIRIEKERSNISPVQTIPARDIAICHEAASGSGLVRDVRCVG